MGTAGAHMVVAEKPAIAQHDDGGDLGCELACMERSLAVGWPNE